MEGDGQEERSAKTVKKTIKGRRENRIYRSPKREIRVFGGKIKVGDLVTKVYLRDWTSDFTAATYETIAPKGVKVFRYINENRTQRGDFVMASDKIKPFPGKVDRNVYPRPEWRYPNAKRLLAVLDG